MFKYTSLIIKNIRKIDNNLLHLLLNKLKIDKCQSLKMMQKKTYEIGYKEDVY